MNFIHYIKLQTLVNKLKIIKKNEYCGNLKTKNFRIQMERDYIQQKIS